MSDRYQQATSTAITYAAGLSTAVGGWLSLGNIALIVGIVTTAILFVAQLLFLRKKRIHLAHEEEVSKKQRELESLMRAQQKEYHKLRMARLNAGDLRDMSTTFIPEPVANDDK